MLKITIEARYIVIDFSLVEAYFTCCVQNRLLVNSVEIVGSKAQKLALEEGRTFEDQLHD